MAASLSTRGRNFLMGSTSGLMADASCTAGIYSGLMLFESAVTSGRTILVDDFHYFTHVIDLSVCVARRWTEAELTTTRMQVCNFSGHETPSRTRLLALASLPH